MMINETRLLNEFLEFVQIDSESGNERKMGEKLVEVLTALGLEVSTDRAGETFGSNGFNVFARLPGEGEPCGPGTVDELLRVQRLESGQESHGGLEGRCEDLGEEGVWWT